MKAVEAFASIGEPENLVEVCKLHMNLVGVTTAGTSMISTHA